MSKSIKTLAVLSALADAFAVVPMAVAVEPGGVKGPSMPQGMMGQECGQGMMNRERMDRMMEMCAQMMGGTPSPGDSGKPNHGRKDAPSAPQKN